MSTGTQESVVIDVWTVPSGRQKEMIEELLAAFEQFRLIEGFIEGVVLANADETKVASYMRVRSPADLERGRKLEEVRERLSALEAIGSARADGYDRMWVITSSTDSGPVRVLRGAF